MDTLKYISEKFNIDFFNKAYKNPIEIPNFGRDDLAGLFRELKFKVGAEIGVESGEYSQTLLIANPDLYLFSIDPWKAHRAYRDHTRQSKFDRFYQNTVLALREFGERSVIMRRYSKEALEMIDDNSLDFVYIDANHKFVEVAFDIHHWLKKVKPGGIVSGHDYTKYKNQEAEIHVHQVLNGYTDAYRITPWFVLGTNEEIPGEIRDKARSWMFVKQ